MAFTVNYAYPTSGSAPTQTTMASLSMVTAQIVGTDGDTGVTVTHNMNLTGAQLANLWPVPVFNYTTAPTTTLANPMQITVLTNTVTLTKVAQTGSAFTGNLAILRPNSIIT